MEEEKQLWERLLEEQTDLFRKTVQKNADLQTRVTDLERELSVWKGAFASHDQEKNALKKQITRLERNIGTLGDVNSLVLCLIDGDGNIFSSGLISQGRSGGIQAAQLLTKGITDYLADIEDGNDDTSSSIYGRAQIWVSVYYNKSGLQDILTSHQVCTADQFDAFVMGFNQASPLFSLTDVGNGKEAADTKIKEYLRIFTRFPQTSKVFFGGAHDNGYASTLNSLNNEGLLHKIVLLKGYNGIAFEIKALNLPFAEFPGVFMGEKLSYNYPFKKNNDKSADNDTGTPRMDSDSPFPSPLKKRIKRRLSNSSSISRYDPQPCNFHYLAYCKAGSACRYGHHYVIDPHDKEIMRVRAKRRPCGMANRNRDCSYGDNCPLGHSCPDGPNCRYYRAGRCKFMGNGMHDAVVDRDMIISSKNSERDSRDPSPSPHSFAYPGTEERTGIARHSAEPAFEPKPEPGSNAWFTKYFPQYQGRSTPAERDPAYTSTLGGHFIYE